MCVCIYTHTHIHNRILLLPLLSHFSRVRLCTTPYMAAHKAPPSLGFSRQDHWSMLLFPSPMHESEKQKWAAQSCLTLCDRIDSSPPGPTVPGILQARSLEWVAISFSNAWKWKVKMKSLSRVGLQPTRLLRPWDFPGKSTGVGCHCLLRILVSVIKDNRV